MFKSFNVVAVVLSLVVAYLRQPIHTDNSISRQLDPKSPAFSGNVLLLTAHPDDECMFFAPTILALAALQQTSTSRGPKSGLHSLCLSVGNADGLGAVRKYELESSLDVLGIDPDKRMIVDNPDLQDNFTASWDAHTIATVLKPYILENRINTILTFDHAGVSGHPNHRSLPEGVKQLMLSLKEVRLFTLITAPPPIKYTGILAPCQAKLDLHLSDLLHFLEDQLARLLAALKVSITAAPKTHAPPEVLPVFLSGIKQYWAAVQAMREHTSQLVWFRWLYILFSRYMWVNEWMEVKVA
ncbi:LmbE-like protein [Mycena pura]|uniref:N-acetylglucosaminylphosphatidylinositol deacetylase n=1 Tax=Mycena pura TaxID=153505 RepID=A0AAD6YJZ0_9AGAR|nr:LmbE-like protein [Mycena pura]